MRINEFQIIHYDPLKPTGQIKLKDFDLFYGKNEYGKTLLIDSIVKILLGRNCQGFYAIDRVDEFPEGYCLITDESGETLKLPEKGDVTQLTKLTATEFRNVFIIRNSDLSIPPNEEFEFYRNVNERLTGLMAAKQIRLIKEELQEIGNLTKPSSSASLSGSASFGNLKSRVKQAENLADEIVEVLEEAGKENFDKLEEGLSKIKETERTTVLEIESLEAAQKREKYKEGKNALGSLSEAIEQLELLEVFDEDDWQYWRQAERDLKRCLKQREDLSKELRETRETFDQKNSIFEGREREFGTLDGRKKTIDEEIRPKLKNYEAKTKELASLKLKEKFFTAFLLGSLILLAISLIGLLVDQSLLFITPAVSFSALAFISALVKLLAIRKRGVAEALWQEIRLNASKFELEAEDVERIFAKIQTFDENYSESQEALKTLETEVSVLKSNVLRLSDEELPEIEKAIKEAEDTINTIRSKSKVDDLRAYVASFRMRQQHEKAKDRSISILKSHFGQISAKAKLDENLNFWDEKIAELEPYKDHSKEIQYSEKEMIRLKEKERKLDAQKKELEQKITSFHAKLQEIGNRANAILRHVENPFLCETSKDLSGIQGALQEFATDVKSNTDTVIEVMRIFEEMEAEEEQTVERLFGEDSPASIYFKEITGGLYQKVDYVSDEHSIRVTTKGGKILDAYKLSGGAYDQLYLSIRLALGEKLLEGAKGFLIMDDPFIKADIDRLRKQLDILKRISKQGWQILYFTAKDEVKTALKEDLADKKIGYHEVQNLFS